VCVCVDVCVCMYESGCVYAGVLSVFMHVCDLHPCGMSRWVRGRLSHIARGRIGAGRDQT